MRPAPGQVAGLLLMETLLVLAWAILLDSLLRFVTKGFLGLLPVTYILAANMLAWLEGARTTMPADPLTARSLAEVDHRGRIPAGWRTLIRVLLTPVLVLTAGAALAPVLAGRRSIPEAAAGVRLVPLDPSLDPRPIGLIRAQRLKNQRTVVWYTVASLLMAGLVLFAPLPDLLRRPGGEAAPHLGMDPGETELLTTYLELSQRFPDSLEYHVRLASLYYRHDMDEDLATELAEVARLDPGHPILLLGEDFERAADTLAASAEFPRLSGTGFDHDEPLLPADSDSVSVDTLAAEPPDSLPQAADSL